MMMGSEELKKLERALGTKKMPEIVFASELLLTFDDRVEISFRARDALLEWVGAENEVCKVKNSERWMKSHLERYGTTTATATAATADDDDGERKMTSTTTNEKIDIGEEDEWDWTFTTPYRGTIRGSSSSSSSSDSNANDSSNNSNQRWKQTDERLDMALLTRRDPIELFEEIALYESELDDHGTSSLSVKIRATDKCWFLLLRFWFCVDGVLIRSRETRLLCDLRTTESSTKVLRETRLREETWRELKDRGAPCCAKKYKDADDAASVLLASGGPVLVINEILALSH